MRSNEFISPEAESEIEDRRAPGSCDIRGGSHESVEYYQDLVVLLIVAVYCQCI